MSNFIYPIKEKVGSDYNSPMNMDYVKTYYRSTLSYGDTTQYQITFEIAGENLVYNYWLFDTVEEREDEMKELRIKLEKVANV